MPASNQPSDVKTERDLVVPSQLSEGYRATFNRLCRMFRARGVPASEVADLAQETITRTLLHLRRRGLLTASTPDEAGADGHGTPVFDGPPDGGIEPLIKRIAINLLIDRARAATPQLLPIDGAEDVAEPGLDLGDEVARRQQRVQVHRAIDDLSSRHRTAMLLSLEGLTPAEIADHLGIQRNAADALLYRARRSLAKHLAAIGGLIRGLAVLAALRVRAAARRVNEASIADATWAGQAAFGLTAATLGTVLAFTLPPAPSADATVPRAPAVSTVTSATEPAATVATPASRETTQHGMAGGEGRADAVVRPKADIDIDDHAVRTGAEFENPSTGEDEGFGIDLLHQRDEHDRGITGPLLDEATGAACDETGSCEE